MKRREIMTTNSVCCVATGTGRDVAKLMGDRNVGWYW
jgi:hypothetical protein